MGSAIFEKNPPLWREINKALFKEIQVVGQVSSPIASRIITYAIIRKRVWNDDSKWKVKRDYQIKKK